MRVGAREGFAHHSLKLGSLANGNRYEVDSNKCFPSGKALYTFEVFPCAPVPTLFLFDTHSYSYSVVRLNDSTDLRSNINQLISFSYYESWTHVFVIQRRRGLDANKRHS
jgi:hypothetical protein